MEIHRPRTGRRRNTRRIAALSCMVALVVTLLSACGSGGGAAPASALPKDLRILTVSGPPTFDQWDTIAQPWGIILLVNEPLVRYDGAEFQPGLAASFEVISPTRYTYTLREGVTFTDGTPLTPADVEYTLRQAKDDTHYATTYVVMSSIKDISVYGNRITVDLVEPEPQFQYVVAQTGIVSKSFYEKNGDQVGTPSVGQVGTGPYRLASFRPDEEMVVERNDDYWGESAPFDSITFAVTKDDSARMLALQSGEADGLFETPISQVGAIEGLDGYTVHEIPDSTLYVLQMDTTKPPFDDPSVREAIRRAVDRKAVTDAAFAGKAVIASTLTSATALESIAAAPVVEETLARFDADNAHDLALARQAMQASGSPDGFEVEVPIDSGDPNLSLIGQTLQQDLAEIGIQVKLKVRGDDYSDVLLKHQHEGLTLNSFTTNTPDPAMPLHYFIPKDGVFNQTGLDNAEAAAALEKSDQYAVGDPRRGELILDALTRLHQAGATLPLAMPNMYVALRDGLVPDGFTNHWWMARWDLAMRVS